MTNRYRDFKTFFHCFEYVIARDALIPEAERIANETVGPKPHNYGDKQDYAHKTATFNWGADWNLVFFREMDRMVREREL